MPEVQLTSRFEEALGYAVRLHGIQTRKGSGVPYVGHLFGTAEIVLHYGGTEIQAIAALLHDAAEDQGGQPRLADIRARFGFEVAAIVDACTDTYEYPKPDWRIRKERYIASLSKKTPEVLLVSVADKLDNARAIVMDLRMASSRDEFWNRFNGGKEGTLWYYEELVNAFRKRNIGPVVDELAEAVCRMKELAGR